MKAEQYQLAIDNSPVYRRVLQAVCDLSRRPLSQLRILDLGSAHGQYSIQLAKWGARVVGIEARSVWLEEACSTLRHLALANAEFVQDDVRNLSKEKYGEFDIVLCLGILYHLDAPDVFEFIDSVFHVCKDFAIFETHYALEPSTSRVWRGRRYEGFASIEHAPGTSPEEKLKNIGASVDNEMSFWFTKASLCNILRHVGFTSVYDCLNPLANLYVGTERVFRIWENRITLVAVKGQRVSLNAAAECDWPENLKDHWFTPSALNFSPVFNELSLPQGETGKTD